MAVTNNFAASSLDLNGQVSLSQPTALVWGPDGRLYVTEVDGDVKVLSIAFGDKNPGDADATAQFYVTSSVTLSLIKGAVQNHNDNGTENTGANRQVTGIDVTQQFDANGDPVMFDGKPAVTMYVTSSDSRIGAGGGGNDANLDTNSGVITMLTQTGPDTWTAIDIVRGLSRSEENHATNGLEVIQEIDPVTGQLISERIIVTSGGNANTGAPSNNFAGQQEQPLSAAILEVDLTMIKSMPVLNDDGRAYVYDIPTLNDPSRIDVGGADASDPFGGNDGRNSAKLLEDGPVSIYSPGYRNAYDVEVTEDGRVWTYDNGANDSWGGRPIGEAGDNGGTVDNAQAAGYIATNLNNGEGNSNDDINLVAWAPSNKDNFHEVTRSDDLDGGTLSAGQGGAQTFEHDGMTYVYGGHPNPTRAEGSRAGLLFSPAAGTDFAYLLVSNQDSYGDGGLTDYEDVVAWLTTVESNNAAFPSSGIFGANAGDLTKKVLAVTPGVLYDIYSFADGSGAAVVAGGAAPAGGTLRGQSGLPADIAEIVAYVNPIEGDYNEAGKTDGALDTGNGSINGLAEYTSTILDAGGVKMSGAILATNLNGGNIIVMGRNADGTMSSTVTGGFATAADRTVLDAGGSPLGIATVGDDYIENGLTQPFQGSIWTAVYGQNGPLIEIFQPNNGAVPLAGSEIVNPTDRDLDGVDYIADPFEFSDDNGFAIAPGEKIVLDFNPQNTNFPTSLASTGLLGAALDGETPNRDAQTAFENFPVDQQFDGLYDIGGNVLPGGNAPILQIKKVIAGTVVGSANSARDVLHTGVLPSADTDRVVATMTVKNWIPAEGGVAPGQLTGMIFGDGTQANFVRFVFGSVNGQPGLEVGYEIGDANYTVLETIALPALANVAVSQLELRLTIDIQNDFALGAAYRLEGEADFTTLDLDDFELPPGVLQDVLTGDHKIGTGAAAQTSGAAFGFLAETSAGNELDAVDFNGLTIEAFGNEIPADTAAEVGNPGTANVDTVIYTGTQTALAPLAANVENFDGSGSTANYAVTGNALDNVIRVGTGANTVTTGAGEDEVRGTLAQLAGDTITDFSADDKVVIEGASLADLTIGYAAGSAQVIVNGQAITFSGETFEDFQPGDGPSTFDITQTEEGVEIALIQPETVIYRVNAGGTDVAAIDGGMAWLGDASFVNGSGPITITGATGTAYSQALTDAQNEIEYDNADPAVAPWQLFVNERSENTIGGTEMTYNFDVEVGKTYKITLFFTENWNNIFTAPARIFDVAVEGAVPAAFDDIHPLRVATDFVDGAGAPLPTIANSGADAEKQPYLGVAFMREFTYTATDDTLNLTWQHTAASNIQNPKVNAIQISELGGPVQPPQDTTPPDVVSISVNNPPNQQDGTRTATVVLTDETGFDAGDFLGLNGSELVFTGIVPASVSAPAIALSNGGQTATLTYTLTAAGNAWPSGVGRIAIAAGAYGDAAGNDSPAVQGAFVLEPNLANLVRGDVVRAINVGTTDAAPGTLGVDLVQGEPDNNRYGGAIAADALITDAAGNPIAFEADNNAWYTSPKTNDQLNANVDGQSGTTGSNSGGVDLDGSAYHTYRDSNADTWTATYTGFAPGAYVVELHFAELFQTAAGTRVGDFFINGQLVADNYDAFAAASGADKPSFIRVPVTVVDGTITVTVDSSAGQAGYSAFVAYEAVDPNLPPTISVGDVQVSEGGDAVVTFTRTGNLDEAVTVEFTVTPGSASAADYTAPVQTTVVIPANQGSASITIPILDDETEESAESFTVTIQEVSGSAVIADAVATVTIAASDSSLQIPAGGTILELDFETAGAPLVEGGFDGVLGGNGALDGAAPTSVSGGKLIVNTSDGDLSEAGLTASKNDFVKAVDLSDEALNEIYITTRFDNPFTAAVLAANGVSNGVIPNYAQQGIVIATNGADAQDPDNFVKTIFGGNAGSAIQMWSQGAIDQVIQISAISGAAAAPFALAIIAAVEMSLAIDKAAGTIAQIVTFFDADGEILGGVRPVATPGFLTAPPLALPTAVADALVDGTTVVGVTSTDYSGGGNAATFDSFPATWDFLSVTSPQYVETSVGDSDSVRGSLVAGGDFADTGASPTDIGALQLGANVIVATQQGDSEPGGRDRDYFTFTVADGQVLSQLVLQGYVSAETTQQGFIGIQQGATIAVDPVTGEPAPGANPLLGGLVYGGGLVGNDILDDMGAPQPDVVIGFETPLPAGTYTVWLNQGGEASTATLNFIVSESAVAISLSIADAAIIGEDGDAGVATLEFGLTASENFSGTVSVTYDAAGQTGLEQEVTFENGVGALIVAVARDDADNGDDEVQVTLTGATGTGDDFVIATATASGTVTEDDSVPALVRGGVVAAFNAGGPAMTFDGVNFAAATSGTTGVFAGGEQYTDGSGGNGEQEVFDGTVYETEINSGPAGDATPGTFTFSAAVEPGKLYFVDLYMAEIYTDAALVRQFDVFVEGSATPVLDNFDIVGTTGSSDTPINLQLIDPIAPGENGAIDLSFVTVLDRAKVSAIVIREAVPQGQIAISAAPTLVEDGDQGFTTLEFPLTISGPDATVIVDFTVNGVADQAELTFVNGAASIAVPVANNNLDNGADAVSVVLTGVPAGFSIAPSAGTAAGSVSEDDAIDPADIDGDLIQNIDDPFAHDGQNGLGRVLTAGAEFRQDFNTPTEDPFSAEGGFTGILVNPAFTPPGASAADPYGDRTVEEKVTIANGALTITSSLEDSNQTGNTSTSNTIRDNYQSGIDVSGTQVFEVATRVTSANFVTALTQSGYAQFGVQVGAGGLDDFVKLVFSDNATNAPRLQLGHNQSILGTAAQSEHNVALPGTILLSNVAAYEIRLTVDRSVTIAPAGAVGATEGAVTAGAITGVVEFFDASNVSLGTLSVGPRYINPSSAFADAMTNENPLTGGTGGIAYGVSITDGTSASNEFTANFDYLSIRSLDTPPPNEAPTAVPIVADAVSETAAPVVIDLLAAANAADSDGGTLGVADVTATVGGEPVAFTLEGAELTIDPAQFAAALGSGGIAIVEVSYSVTDGQGGATPNTATLTVEGLDGPFTFYIDADADGFGASDPLTDVSAYEAPGGYAAQDGDADDADATVYPDAPEINDGKDNDQDGQFDEDNGDPVAVDDDATIGFNGVLTISVADLLANDSDPDLDALTIVSVQDAVNGTVSLDAGVVTFTPAPGYSGPASFSYTVSDGVAANPKSDTATVNVTVGAFVNTPPMADAIDAGAVAENAAPVVIDLLADANAADSDGGTLGVADVSVTTGGAAVAFTLDGATLTIDPALFAEQLATGASAVLSVAYTVIDGQGGATPNTATLTIDGLDGPFTYYVDGDGDGFGVSDPLTDVSAYEAPGGYAALDGDAADDDPAVYPGAPEFNDGKDNNQDGEIDEANGDPVTVDDAATVGFNGVLTIPVADLLANDSDPDIDALAVVSVQDAVNGTVSLDAGVVTFTPAPGYSGAASFSYSVSDGFNGAATGTVSVTVESDDTGDPDPVTVRIQAEDATLGGGYVVGAAAPADGGQLIWIPDGQTTGTATFNLAAEGVPPGLYTIRIGYVDESDGESQLDIAVSGSNPFAGSFDLTDDATSGNAAQASSFRVRAFEGVEVDANSVLTLTGVRHAGEHVRIDYVEFVGVTDDADDNLPPFAPFGIDDQVLLQNETLDVDLAGLFADPEEDALTFTIDGPAWLSIVDGRLTGTPGAGDATAGETVTVYADDGFNPPVPVTFQLTVNEVNAPPTTTEIADQILRVGESASISVADAFDDANGDELTYAIAGDLPPGLSFDPDTGVFTGGPTTAGSYQVTVTASDGEADVDSTFVFNVLPAADSRPTLRIEAETFDLVSGFFVENLTGGRAGIRLLTSASGEAVLDFAGTGATGAYDLRIAFLDESDGVSAASLSVDADGSGTFSPLGSFSFNQSGGGNAGQAQNLRVLTFPGLEIGAGTVLKLNATAHAGEYARFDYIELVPVAGDVNFAPFVSNGIDDVTQATPAALAIDIQAAGAFADPEEDALSYQIVSGPAWLSVVDGVLTGTPPSAGVYAVTIGATDGPGNSGVTVQTSFTITVEGNAPVNAAPTAVIVTPVLTEIPEGTLAAATKVADIAVTDDALGTNVLSLIGADADLFEIVGQELFLKAGAVLDFETNPSLDVSVQVDDAAVGSTPDASAGFALTVTDVDEPVGDAYAPEGDLDTDTIANNVDTDVDGDGILNVDDAFAYDAENGMTLTPGETRLFDFDVDGTIYQNGMTGLVQGTTNGGAFDENTGASSVSGGLLTVNPVSSGDTGTTNNPQDDAQVGVKNGSFTATAVVVNPWFGAAANPNSFDQLGLALGLNSDDMIKLVFGQAAGVVEFQKQETSNGTTTATKYGGTSTTANVPLPVGAGLDDFARAEITFEVVSIDATSATVTGTVAFLAANGSVIATVNYGAAPIGGALAAALFDPAVGVGVGFTHVDGGGAPGFVAQLDSLSITAAGAAPVNQAPTAVTLTPVVTGIEEGTSVATKVADIVVADDGLGVNVLGLTGADAAMFEIVGNELFLKAGETLDVTANPTLDVAVTVNDATVGATPDATSVPLAIPVTEAGGGADEIVLRINAFGPEVAAIDGGPDWLADNGAGSSYLVTTDNRGDTQGYSGDVSAIPAGVPEGVLDTARSSNAPFSYNIPVADIGGPGAYRVNLYIAELFPGGQGSAFRIFDASLEGAVPVAFNNITPGTTFGADVGMLSAEIQVTDGVLNIGLLQDAVEGVQNPIVNAIEIVRLGGGIADTQAPTAAISLTNPVDADSPLLVNITLTDASGINPATLGAEDLQLLIGGGPAAATIGYVGFAGNVASYTIAAPAGGWSNGLAVTVGLVAGQVADLASPANVNLATSQSLTLAIGGGSGDALAPGGDLDGDGIANTVDPNVDGAGAGDGNQEDHFAYDAGNGVLLASGEVINLDFNTDGTPYQAGFTGLLQGGTTGAALATFDEETGTATVSGGRLNVTASNGDTGSTNDPEDDYQLGIKNRAFTVEARVDNPFDGPAANYQQLGLHVGIDSTDFVKFVFGFDDGVVEFSVRNNDAETKVSGGNIALPATLGGLGGFEAVDIRLIVNATSPTAATVQAFATFLDASGQPIAGATNVGFGTASITGALAAALYDESVGVGTGFTQTSYSSGATFEAQLDSFKVTGGSGGTVTPPDPGNAEEAFASQSDLDTSASYAPGVNGSAVLKIMEGQSGVAASNFGASSFQVENTGAKKISAIFIDVTSALYPDSIFDPDGLGGDSAAKAWAVDSAGNTGGYVTGTGFFLPGQAPLPNSGGSGGASNGGFKGAMIKFNPDSSGGFQAGEVVGFSGDMDPNSIAGMAKSSVDSGATQAWDVGGISGHELIGSLFTVLFDDGTTASGQLISDESNAGSIAIAAQGLSAEAVSLTVNGTAEGGLGVYGGSVPTVIVTGDPGQLVRITMTRGFDPVTNETSGIDDLVQARLARYDFKASNAFDEQSVDVTIGADGTFNASNLFDYGTASGTGKGSFAGDTVAQIGFVASAIGTVNGDVVPVGPVTAPIYLTNQGGPVTGGGGVLGADGYFQIIGNTRFKVQIEDPNANGGTNPGGDWTYVAGDDPGSQTGTQGTGHYFWGSESASIGVNNPEANSFLNYTIFIPEGQGGVYNFRIRSSRDTNDPSDQRNDVWLRIDDDAEELQTSSTNSVSSNGFIKIFGAGTNWGFAGQIDSVSESEANFGASFNLSAGLHTITLAGRSDGFHADFWELYKGSAPAVSATNSAFVPTGPTVPTVAGPIGDQQIEEGSAYSFTIPAATFADVDGDTLAVSIAAPAGFTVNGTTITAPGSLPQGDYTIVVTATDDDQNSVTDTFVVSVVEEIVVTDFQAVVETAQDDIEVGGSATSSDLETNQVVQLRFTVADGVSNVTSVNSAVMSWQSDRTHGGNSTLTFQVENSLDAEPFGAGKTFIGGSEVVQVTATWQDNATITNVVDLADQINALIASQGPLNAGDTINLQLTGTGAVRYIAQASAVLDMTAGSGGGGTGGSTGSTSASIAAGSSDIEISTLPTSVLEANLTSQNLEFGTDNFGSTDAAEPQKTNVVGMRFTGLEMPDDAEITDAYLEFQAFASSSAASDFDISIQNSLTGAVFTTTVSNFTGRNFVGAVDWVPEAWVSGQTYRTPDISSLIEQVIGNGGLDAADALVFRVTGTGVREAHSFEAAGAQPVLRINYGGGGGTPDPVLPTIAVADAGSVAEGAGAAFVVSLSEPATAPVTVTWSTTNGTAAAPGDFTAASSQTLTIAAGQTTGTITVQTANDTLPEGAESFGISIGASQGGTALVATKATATGTIAASDQTGPTLTFKVTGTGGFVDTALADGDVYTPASLGAAPMFAGTFTSGSAASVKIDLLNASGAVIGTSTENLTPYDFTYGGPALAEGAYTLRATSYAGTGATGAVLAAQEFDFAVDDGVGTPPPTSGTVTVGIATSADDAESHGGTTSDDIELGVLQSGVVQSVGLRFTGIDLAESAEIESAYFIFEAEATNAGAANLQIQIQNSTSAATYPNGASVDARGYLPETVAWSNVAPWQAGQSYQSADVSALIEDLIGNGGLEASDAIAFRITGTGTRQAFSFDSAGEAPQLVINYVDSLFG